MLAELDGLTVAILVVFGLFLGGMFLTVLVQTISSFRQDLRYINMEIARTRGEERQYWKHEKRRLWLTLLPFYRR